MKNPHPFRPWKEVFKEYEERYANDPEYRAKIDNLPELSRWNMDTGRIIKVGDGKAKKEEK